VRDDRPACTSVSLLLRGQGGYLLLKCPQRRQHRLRVVMGQGVPLLGQPLRPRENVACTPWPETE
jgi:hypothetical protein